jgi:hypothetical protein
VFAALALARGARDSKRSDNFRGRTHLGSWLGILPTLARIS